MLLFLIVVLFLNEWEFVECFGVFVDKFVFEIKSCYGFDLEVVFVDDGSIDDSIECYWEYFNGNWCIIEFSCNFGKEVVFYVGFVEMCGDYVMMIDVDLQYFYDVCIQMIDELMGDFKFDVVYIIWDDCNEEFWKKVFVGCFFYWFINFCQCFEVFENVGDFCVMNWVVVDVLLCVCDK